MCDKIRCDGELKKLQKIFVTKQGPSGLQMRSWRSWARGKCGCVASTMHCNVLFSKKKKATCSLDLAAMFLGHTPIGTSSGLRMRRWRSWGITLCWADGLDRKVAGGYSFGLNS